MAANKNIYIVDMSSIRIREKIKEGWHIPRKCLKSPEPNTVGVMFRKGPNT